MTALYPFRQLLASHEEILDDGLYLDVGKPAHVRLMFTDHDQHDFLLPKSGAQRGLDETLSFVTGQFQRVPATHDRVHRFLCR